MLTLKIYPYYKFSEDSVEYKYMKARREALGGSMPARREQAEESLEIPSLKIFRCYFKRFR